MKKISILIILSILIGCGSTTTYSSPDVNPESNSFGTDQTLEVITWNLENFAKNGDVTVNRVEQILDSLDVDIIALQEIENVAKFNQLDQQLADWQGYLSSGAAYDINTAYLYRKDLDPDIYQILTNEWYALPRSPLVMEVQIDGQEIIIINNHFKAGGDADDIARRREGSELLHEYICNNYDSENVIVLGDLNDQLTDNNQMNVFLPFLNDADNFLFADYSLEVAGVENYSYPNWPSHLDHILISNELFDEFDHVSSDIQTLHVDEFFINFDQYEEDVSDHLPVGIKLFLR
jgi:endonuclease/exonuclease/phosphatase family metal-dependent hydrolase